MINLSAMDMGLSIGFFALFALFGSLDYATIFSMSPFMNESAITIISLLIFMGAMAKSAQLGLHSWLPGSMEAKVKTSIFLFLNFMVFIFMLKSIATQAPKGESVFIFSSLNSMIIVDSNLPAILLTVPKEILCSITGNLLGDGSLRPGSRSRQKRYNSR